MPVMKHLKANITLDILCTVPPGNKETAAAVVVPTRVDWLVVLALGRNKASARDGRTQDQEFGSGALNFGQCRIRAFNPMLRPCPGSQCSHS
jgi:hypothetical protein